MTFKITSVVLAVVVIVVSIFGIREHIEEKRYESYLSLNLTNGFSALSSDILNNQKIYEDISNSGTLSLKQVENLYRNNSKIQNVTADYEGLAVTLKKGKNKQLTGDTTTIANQMALLLQNLIWNFAKQNDIKRNWNEELPYSLPYSKKYKVTKDNLKQIKQMTQLNNLWIQSLETDIKGFSKSGINPDAYFKAYLKNGINSKFWISALENMDKQSTDYLKNNPDFLPIIRKM